PICRHQALVGYLGEDIAPCKASCDVCSGRDMLSDSPRVAVKKKSRSRNDRAATPNAPPVRERFASDDTEGATLFDELRKLRKKLADERNVPAYVVFSDATLLQMAQNRPISEADLMDISGVGPKKVAAYGAAFVALIRENSKGSF